MKNLVFLNDSIINKEIAFVLGIKFKLVSKKNINKKDLYYVSDDEEKKYLEANGYKYKKNYIDFEYLLKFLDKYNRKRTILGRFKFFKNIEEINKIRTKKLALSEMLIKVLYSKPKDIDCNELDFRVQVDENGDVWGCCPGWVSIPFGNILKHKDLYSSYYTRLIKLSSLNKTFCFCDLKRCRHVNSKEIPCDKVKIDFKIKNAPEYVIFLTDNTCNLRCVSCRKEFYTAPKRQREKTRLINKKVFDTGWLENATIMMAGQGEIFFSQEYLRLLNMIKHGKKLDILSNGNLFDESKWKMVKEKFDDISVSISMDAATKETYKKIRHGNFDKLVKNINMLSKYRKEGKFHYFKLNFVVQKGNMHEIIDFVKFAIKNNADVIHLMKMNYWKNTVSYEQYLEECLIIDYRYLDYELYKIFQDPIFSDKRVNISEFKYFIEESKRIYEKE